jgi:hypothetical protein
MAAGEWQEALPFIANSLSDEPKAISMLLCTSRAASQVIHQSCIGSMELACHLRNEAQAQQFAAFLAKHARLLKALDVQLPDDRKERETAEQLLAAALNKASTSAARVAEATLAGGAVAAAAVQKDCGSSTQQPQQQQQLFLRSFHCKHTCRQLLQQVVGSCSSSLTRVEVSVHTRMHQHDADATAAAVANLSSLRTLSLTFNTDQTPGQSSLSAGAAAPPVNSDGTYVTGAMLSAVMHLPQLTHLQLNNIHTPRGSSSSSLAYVTQLLAGLPDLCSFELSCVPLDATSALDDTASAAPAAAAAASLTRLQLRDCDLTDDVLLSLVRGMSALQRMDISSNMLLTDAALTGLAGQLPQLEELHAVVTSITHTARSSLQATRPGLTVKLGRAARKPVSGLLVYAWYELPACVGGFCLLLGQWCC